LGDKTPIRVHAGNFSATTGDFTRSPANTTANGGQGVRPTGYKICLLETIVGNRAYITAGVRMHRTGYLAGNQLPMITIAGDFDM
jgi:hypothetical protein